MTQGFFERAHRPPWRWRRGLGLAATGPALGAGKAVDPKVSSIVKGDPAALGFIRRSWKREHGTEGRRGRRARSPAPC